MPAARQTVSVYIPHHQTVDRTEVSDCYPVNRPRARSQDGRLIRRRRDESKVLIRAD